MENILSFCTGSEVKPLLGFGIPPTIHFCVLPGFLPTASTCANIMNLPIPESRQQPMPPRNELFENLITRFPINTLVLSKIHISVWLKQSVRTQTMNKRESERVALAIHNSRDIVIQVCKILFIQCFRDAFLQNQDVFCIQSFTFGTISIGFIYPMVTPFLTWQGDCLLRVVLFG